MIDSGDDVVSEALQKLSFFWFVELQLLMYLVEQSEHVDMVDHHSIVPIHYSLADEYRLILFIADPGQRF